MFETGVCGVRVCMHMYLVHAQCYQTTHTAGPLALSVLFGISYNTTQSRQIVCVSIVVNYKSPFPHCVQYTAHMHSSAPVKS